MSKRKSKATKLKILNALKEKAPLSTNKGKIENTPKRRPTSKQRRHKGWVYPWVPPGMKYSEIVENALDPAPYWDDWIDFRDGMRGTKDRTKFIRKGWAGGLRPWWGLSEEEIMKRNDKLRKEILIRKARKEKRK